MANNFQEKNDNRWQKLREKKRQKTNEILTENGKKWP